MSQQEAKYLVHPLEDGRGYGVVMHTTDGDQVLIDTARSYGAAEKKAAIWTRREAQGGAA